MPTGSGLNATGKQENNANQEIVSYTVPALSESQTDIRATLYDVLAVIRPETPSFICLLHHVLYARQVTTRYV